MKYGDRVEVEDVYGQWHLATVVNTFTTDTNVKVETDRWGALGNDRYPVVAAVSVRPV